MYTSSYGYVQVLHNVVHKEKCFVHLNVENTLHIVLTHRGRVVQYDIKKAKRKETTQKTSGKKSKVNIYFLNTLSFFKILEIQYFYTKSTIHVTYY